ncbi:MAG: fused DSP-PTPase phosphatase/NAD kinase-like protein [Gemmataceae bacterium]
MQTWMRWSLGLFIAWLVLAVPLLYYRYDYGRKKRLRVVTPGVLYRSGQMTAAGFADAVRHYGIRTIINAQDEFPDPNIRNGFLDSSTVRESELCRQLGVRYVHISPSDLVSPNGAGPERPPAIDAFLAIMDDPTQHPVLLHCRAGLHRTGVLSAVYRMEYEQWTPLQAINELRRLGFGEYASTSGNEYITQYILTYRPGIRMRPKTW